MLIPEHGTDFVVGYYVKSTSRITEPCGIHPNMLAVGVRCHTNQHTVHELNIVEEINVQDHLGGVSVFFVC